MTHFCLLSLMVPFYFNSHPHEEDDEGISFKEFRISISTHILTRRMTVSYMHTGVIIYISTHILTRRMTSRTVIHDSSGAISTHILTRRMTKCFGFFRVSIRISTHILTRRMTFTCLYPLRLI